MNDEKKQNTTLEDIRDELARLHSKLEALEAGIKQSDKKQQPLGRFLTPILVTAVVSLAATIVSSDYNNRQLQLRQMEALDKYHSYIISEDDKKRQFAYQVFEELGYRAFLLRLLSNTRDPAGLPFLGREASALVEERGTAQRLVAQKLADDIMRDPVSREGVKLPTPVLSVASKTPSAEAQVTDGWIYLGHFDPAKGEEGGWKTHYLEGLINETPSTLAKKQDPVFEVREETGALNLRKGMPEPDGRFPEVQDVLKVGSSVTIKEVREWHSTGYIWARVEYRT